MQLDNGFTLRVSAAVETTGWIHVQKGRRDRGSVGGWQLGFGQPRGGADAPWGLKAKSRRRQGFWGICCPPSPPRQFVAPS